MKQGHQSDAADIDEIVAVIRAKLVALAPLEATRISQLSRDSEIRKLGLDSLTLLEMIMSLEDRIRRPLDERALSKAHSLGDIAAIVRDELESAGASIDALKS